MCRMFSDQSPERYQSQTRSIRLGGHSTSIRMEGAFWNILEDLAREERMTLAQLINALNDEVMMDARLPENFTSLLRCACLTHLARQRERVAA